MSVVTLPAFSKEQQQVAFHLLAARVAYMMGRKFEEDDWAHVYCNAKGIPHREWSNLNIDVMHEGLGVEHKMVAYRSKPLIAESCGTTIMHPSATRAIRIPNVADANEAMREILTQYADLIADRTRKVREDFPKRDPDMRTGWLLWQVTLKEFLYFEERMTAPDWRNYTAEWKERESGTSRKGSRNLWIYEKKTSRKRFSVTTEAGAKIQPYFDIPLRTDPNLYIFTVQGQEIKSGFVRVWLTTSTAEALESLIGSLDCATISRAILQATRSEQHGSATLFDEDVREVTVTSSAYGHLRDAFNGVSDEHRFRLLIKQLKSANDG